MDRALTQLPLRVDDGSRIEYLTVAQAAERVRCCERTIRRAIDSGELRAGRVRGGGSNRGGWRIRPKDLEAWLFAEDGGGDAGA